MSGNDIYDSTGDVKFNDDLDMQGNDIQDVDQIDFQVTGQRIDGAPTGLEYEVPSGDTHKFYVSGGLKMTMSGSHITFGDSAVFQHHIQGNNGLTMQSGDVSLSGTGRIDLVSTGGSPGSFDGYVAIKVGGSTKYIQIYS